MKDIYRLVNKLEKSGYSYRVGHMQNYEQIVWAYLQDTEMFTENELILVCDINGYNLETLNDMIFARFGYRDLEQMLESGEF